MVAQLVVAGVFLLAMVAYSISLGAFARSRTVKNHGHLFMVGALALFVLGIYYLVSLWSLFGGARAVTIGGLFVLSVFFLGSMVVCNQDVRFANGAVRIRQDSWLYRLLINFCQLSPEKHRSLCSLSWVGMFAIIFMPCLILVMHVVSILIGIVSFLFAGQNPVRPLVSCFKMTIKNREEGIFQTLYVGGIPAAPAIPAAAIAAVYCLLWLVMTHLAVFRVIGLSLASLVILALIAGILVRLVQRTDAHKLVQPAMEPVFVGLVRNAAVASRIVTVPASFVGRTAAHAAVVSGRGIARGVVTPFEFVTSLLRVFKKTACPPIIFEK